MLRNYGTARSVGVRFMHAQQGNSKGTARQQEHGATSQDRKVSRQKELPPNLRIYELTIQRQEKKKATNPNTTHKIHATETKIIQGYDIVFCVAAH